MKSMSEVKTETPAFVCVGEGSATISMASGPTESIIDILLSSHDAGNYRVEHESKSIPDECTNEFYPAIYLQNFGYNIYGLYELTYAYIPTDVYHIGDTSNIIYFRLGSKSLSCKIPTGSYDSCALAGIVSSVMTKACGGEKFTMRVSSARILCVGCSAPFMFQWGTHTDQSAASSLGFRRADTPVATDMTASRPMVPVPSLRIYLSTGELNTKRLVVPICRLGGYSFGIAASAMKWTQYINMPRIGIRQLTVYIEDPRGNTVIVSGDNWEIYLHNARTAVRDIGSKATTEKINWLYL